MRLYWELNLECWNILYSFWYTIKSVAIKDIFTDPRNIIIISYINKKYHPPLQRWRQEAITLAPTIKISLLIQSLNTTWWILCLNARVGVCVSCASRKVVERLETLMYQTVTVTFHVSRTFWVVSPFRGPIAWSLVQAEVKSTSQEDQTIHRKRCNVTRHLF